MECIHDNKIMIQFKICVDCGLRFGEPLGYKADIQKQVRLDVLNEVEKHGKWNMSPDKNGKWVKHSLVITVEELAKLKGGD